MRIGLKGLGIALIAAVVVAGGALAVGAGAMWSAGCDFGPAGNYISELSVGPGASSIAFVVMIVGLAIFTGVFFIGAPSVLPKVLPGSAVSAAIGRVFGIVGTAALLALVFFPLDPARPSTHTAHIALAIAAFMATSGEMVAYSRVFAGQRGLLRGARIAAICCAPLTSLFAVLAFLVEIVGALPPVPAVFIVEWLAFISFAVWIMLSGVGLITRGKPGAGGFCNG